MTPISIRFPMTREKTGNRRGRRFRRVPDTANLHGAAGCAARMICIAIRKREAWQTSMEHLRTAKLWGKQDIAWLQPCVELDAHSVRESAFWARRFAKSIPDTDPRWAVIEADGKALRERLHAHTIAHQVAA